MDGALVFSAGLGDAGAQRHVEAAADLLIEQYLAGEGLDALVGADGKLAQVARPGVGIEGLIQKVLVLFGGRLDRLGLFRTTAGRR